MLSTSTLIICQLALSPCLNFYFFKQFIRSVLKSCAQNCARLFYDTGNYYCMVNTNTLLSWGSLGIVLRENQIVFYTFIQNLYLQTNLAVKIFGRHQSSTVRRRVQVLSGLFIFTVSKSTDALLAVTLHVLSDSSWADTFALSHCLRCSTNKLHSGPRDGRVWERTVCLPLMKLWTIHGRKHRAIPIFPSAVWFL